MPPIHRPLETYARFREMFGSDPVPVAAALAQGISRGSLDAAVRRGLLVRPRYGVLRLAEAQDACETAPLLSRGDGDRRRHLARLRATLVAIRGDDVLAAGASAAVVHGLAIPDLDDLDVVHLVRPDGSGYGEPSTRRRGSPVPPSDRTILDGIAVTTLERTAVELARGQYLPQALIPLDSAARLLVTRETGSTGNDLRAWVRDAEMIRFARARLTESLSHLHGWAGTVRVRDALRWVHPASESPLESRSRGWFIEAGLGPLDPGSPVDAGSATYWADFCSRERGVLGEADGWSKYGRTPEEVRSALAREKKRAAVLEAQGWRLVRWTTADPRTIVVDRMARALRPSQRP